MLPKTLAKQDPDTQKRNKEEKMAKTLIVLKPTSRPNNSHEIRKEFNKQFPDIAIKAAIPTVMGSVRLEFESNSIREEVASKWSQNMFGRNDGIKKPSYLPTVGIIKQVDVTECTEDIIEHIQDVSEDTDVDFFRKNGKLTGTLKLKFKDHEEYKKIMDEGGIKIFGVKYIMDEFVFKPKVIRCYKCQAYGHISHNCRSKTSTCGKCCKEGHESVNCQEEIRHPKCFHCKGEHFTGSKICTEYQKAEGKINPQTKHGF